MHRRRNARIQLKALGDDGVFEGYGAVFGNQDSYGEVILPGAFKDSLRRWGESGSMPPVLWQHKRDEPLGLILEMEEDDRGLFIRGQLLIKEVQRAKEAHSLLKNRAISGLSIGYVPVVDEYDRDEGIVYLKEIDLWEISVVTFPANPEAGVTTVKANNIKTIRDFEAVLRDELGFSRAQAKALASAGWKALDGGEPRDVVSAIEALETRIRDAMNQQAHGG